MNGFIQMPILSELFFVLHTHVDEKGSQFVYYKPCLADSTTVEYTVLTDSLYPHSAGELGGRIVRFKNLNEQ